jgi:hypothetical protein
MQFEEFRAICERAAAERKWVVSFYEFESVLEAWFRTPIGKDVAQAYLEQNYLPVGLPSLDSNKIPVPNSAPLYAPISAMDRDADSAAAAVNSGGAPSKPQYATIAEYFTGPKYDSDHDGLGGDAILDRNVS